ncbi:CGNR zinc finger domain-containing protein [Paramicrobacterium agarici]|uniref:CGNR zinc finger domain-containing protein n=1 Tax=Paramicrobacterium agarici TaxID=630514 RepID=UPI0011746E89|nr:CGNR zinc finger domain-containing protein [Microbacterium agarici]TQO23545.1 putative RNA-binding Zn ribbon-like protein [Microbacterium agarici]
MISGERLSETGQWLESQEGTRWWYDSGALCLDFAYTGPNDDTGDGLASGWEQLVNSADLDEWLSDRFTVSAANERDLRDALTLREAIAHVMKTAAAQKNPLRRDIDIINLYAATPDLPPRLDGGSRQAGRTMPRTGQALSTIARDAVSVFGGERGGIIRTCDADDCALIYLDVSRAGTRRWCSMQRCGNRHKVRQHRARQRAKAEANAQPAAQ